MRCPGSGDYSILCDATITSHAHCQPGLEQTWAMLCAEEGLARRDWKRPSDTGQKKTLRDEEKIFFWSWHCSTWYNPGFQFLSFTLDKNVIFSSPVEKRVNWRCLVYKCCWVVLSLALLDWDGWCSAIQMLCTFDTVADHRSSSKVPPMCTQWVEGRL